MRLRSISLRATLLASITAGLAASVSAQTGPAAPVAPVAAADAAADDDIIIVTASKRAATLQDTPISVAVTTGAAIQQAQVRDLLDLQTLVPSLRVAQFQSSANTRFSIRGFGNGDNNIGIEPSVGVFIDGVYRSRSAAQIGDLPNLERVEVLRGPQSTLFGKNASAGVISIVTREPQFDFGGSAEFSYGNYNAIVARADVTGPLTDSIAFSLAGNLNKRDGFINDPGLGVDFNERDRWGVRGSLLFKPSDDFKLRLIADYDKIDENCCGVVNIRNGPTGAAVFAIGGKIVPNAPFSETIFNNFASSNRIENYGFSGQGDWNATDTLAVTAIGSYRAVRSKTNQDSDFTSADLIGNNENDTRINTYTAELRLASSYDGPLNFLLGGFYFNEKIDVDANLLYGRDFRNYANALTAGAYTRTEALLAPLGIRPGSFGAVGQGRFENYEYKNSAISAFGQLDFEPVDGLVFTAGGNYTNDKKDVITNNRTTDVFSALDFAAIGAGALGIPPALANNPAVNPLLGLRPLQFIPPFLNFPNAVENGQTRDDNFSYTLRVAYKIDDRFSVYATHATGFKASSWNLSIDSRPFAKDFIPGPAITNPPTSPIRAAGLALPNLTAGTRFADPEDATVYEAGIKGQFDGFNFNFAIFKQTLENFQGNFFLGTGFTLTNAEKQSTFGIELDAMMRPIRNLTINASFVYLNPKFDSFTNGVAYNAGFTLSPANLTGLRPAGVPEFSLSVGGDYSHDFSDALKGVFHIDFAHDSAVNIGQNLPGYRREIESLNSAATLVFNNKLDLTIWGRNLTDTKYIASLFASVAQAGSLSGYRNQPRTYGASVRYRF